MKAAAQAKTKRKPKRDCFNFRGTSPWVGRRMSPWQRLLQAGDVAEHTQVEAPLGERYLSSAIVDDAAENHGEKK